LMALGIPMTLPLQAEPRQGRRTFRATRILVFYRNLTQPDAVWSGIGILPIVEMRCRRILKGGEFRVAEDRGFHFRCNGSTHAFSAR